MSHGSGFKSCSGLNFTDPHFAIASELSVPNCHDYVNFVVLLLLFFFIAGKGVGWGTERGWGPRQQTVNTYIYYAIRFYVPG